MYLLDHPLLVLLQSHNEQYLFNLGLLSSHTSPGTEGIYKYMNKVITQPAALAERDLIQQIATHLPNIQEICVFSRFVV
jgi:hypothetical protein